MTGARGPIGKVWVLTELNPPAPGGLTCCDSCRTPRWLGAPGGRSTRARRYRVLRREARSREVIRKPVSGVCVRLNTAPAFQTKFSIANPLVWREGLSGKLGRPQVVSEGTSPRRSYPLCVWCTGTSTANQFGGGLVTSLKPGIDPPKTKGLGPEVERCWAQSDWYLVALV